MNTCSGDTLYGKKEELIVRRLFAILLIVVMTCSCITAGAENALKSYADIINGTWDFNSYSGVSKNNYPAFYYVYNYGQNKTLTYPFGAYGSSGYYFLELVGDESGEVYMICSTNDTSTAGRVFLSSNGETMLIVMPDGAQFIYSKQKK